MFAVNEQKHYVDKNKGIAENSCYSNLSIVGLATSGVGRLKGQSLKLSQSDIRMKDMNGEMPNQGRILPPFVRC